MPNPPEDYVQFPHKGGAELKQPLDENEKFELEMTQYEKEHESEPNKEEHIINKTIESEKKKEFQVLKLIRKIWER